MRITASIITLLFSALAPIHVFAYINFVEGIWFTGNLVENSETKIMTAIRNDSEKDEDVEVRFFENDIVISKISVNVPKKSVRVASVSNMLAHGTHRIKAVLARKDKSESKIGSVLVNIDADTDKDGIGDSTDEDIDGDGLTNTEEKNIGTDTTKKDTDLDGVDDAKELSSKTNPLDKSDVPINDPIKNTTAQITSLAKTATETAKKVKRAIDPRADSVATKIENFRDIQIAKSLPKNTEAPKIEKASSLKNFFLASSASANLDWLDIWDKTIAIGLSLAAFMVRDWLWTIIAISSLSFVKMAYRWQKREY